MACMQHISSHKGEEKRKKDTGMSDWRDWADLPPELLHLITRQLPPDLLYFIRFRAVCKTWRSFSPLSNPPPQLPWLLEYSTTFWCGTDPKEELHFYSLATGKTGIMHAQDPFFSKKHRYRLNFLQIDERRGFVLIGSNPRWSFPWLPYQVKDLQQDCSDTLDACYNWPNMFDSIPTDKVLNIVSRYNKPVCSFVTSYSVESCGEILRVIKFEDLSTDLPCYLHIYKLKSQGGRSSWVKVRDIGDQILFLDEMNGFSMTAPAGFKGNCVYFLSYTVRFSARRFEIATGTVENVPCPFGNCTWFLPVFADLIKQT